jgi:hypothetical protein
LAVVGWALMAGMHGYMAATGRPVGPTWGKNPEPVRRGLSGVLAAVFAALVIVKFIAG